VVILTSINAVNIRWSVGSSRKSRNVLQIQPFLKFQVGSVVDKLTIPKLFSLHFKGKSQIQDLTYSQRRKNSPFLCEIGILNHFALWNNGKSLKNNKKNRLVKK